MVKSEMDKPKEPDYTYEEAIDYTPIPDSNRDIYTYDWDRGRFIYKDEVPDDTVDHSKDTIEFYPDYFIQVIDEVPNKK